MYFRIFFFLLKHKEGWEECSVEESKQRQILMRFEHILWNWHIHLYVLFSNLQPIFFFNGLWRGKVFKACDMTLNSRGVSLTPQVVCTSRWWMTYSKHQMMWIDCKIILWSKALLLGVFSLFIWQQGKKEGQEEAKADQSSIQKNPLKVRQETRVMTWCHKKLWHLLKYSMLLQLHFH